MMFPIFCRSISLQTRSLLVSFSLAMFAFHSLFPTQHFDVLVCVCLPFFVVDGLMLNAVQAFARRPVFVADACLSLISILFLIFQHFCIVEHNNRVQLLHCMDNFAEVGCKFVVNRLACVRSLTK